MSLPRRSRKRAFTLLELIVVLVILGLLAALAIPTFAKVIERSRDTVTLTTLQAVAREAQALRAFDQAAWSAGPVEAAISETSYAASTGVSAAGTAYEAKPDAGADPASTEMTYVVSGEYMAVAARSGSKVCVVAANHSAITSSTCGAAAGEGASRLGQLLSDSEHPLFPVTPGSGEPGSEEPSGEEPSGAQPGTILSAVGSPGRPATVTWVPPTVPAGTVSIVYLWQFAYDGVGYWYTWGEQGSGSNLSSAAVTDSTFVNQGAGTYGIRYHATPVNEYLMPVGPVFESPAFTFVQP